MGPPWRLWHAYTYISLVGYRGVAAALDTGTAGPGPCALDRSTGPVAFVQYETTVVLSWYSPQPRCIHPRGVAIV